MKPKKAVFSRIE